MKKESCQFDEKIKLKLQIEILSITLKGRYIDLSKTKCHVKQGINKLSIFIIHRSIMRASTRKRLNFSMKDIMKELNAIVHEVNAI